MLHRLNLRFVSWTRHGFDTRDPGLRTATLDDALPPRRELLLPSPSPTSGRGQG